VPTGRFSPAPIPGGAKLRGSSLPWPIVYVAPAAASDPINGIVRLLQPSPSIPSCLARALLDHLVVDSSPGPSGG
jgi:hypothetical protein